MAQSLTSKISKLAQTYSITAIIDTAKQVQQEQADIAVWDAMSTDEKTEWFYNQCKKYSLTTTKFANQISVNELLCSGKHGGTKAYFCVFLPHPTDNFRGSDPSAWHLEIGSAYASPKHGTIWPTARGLKGKELQIQQVIRLHKEGK